ncbi:MAG TPA: DUF1549 and DUF1553 domain-containing protein [Verrucomicrobiales bacterium]|nr:DUF1549 and DUF1553 domain-containing protein [Verrucomicrobiales bacterium]
MEAFSLSIALLAAALSGADREARGATSVPVAPPSFRHDVMAVLSKAGCNTGACHGNQNGKNGFKLSLRGEDPTADLRALTRDLFGRRIDRFEPENSLLLLKATRSIAHEGGVRFNHDSSAYQILRDWIQAGAQDDRAELPALSSLEVTPLERYLEPGEDAFPLRVTARFSDGSSRDVTQLAVYEPSDPLLEVSPDGQVNAKTPGESVVLVRFLSLQVPVRVYKLQETHGFTWNPPAALNRVDEFVFAKLKRLRIPLSAPAPDPVFLRRAWLDLAGFPPDAESTRRFLADADPHKHAGVIDDLLQRPEFAEFWALKWCDLLRVEEKALDRKGVQAFHRWILDALEQGMPLDRFAQEILSARGSTYAHPPANFYRSHRTPVQRAETVAQVFLGRRLQCAQCHNHPFDRWTQDDYYDWTSVFGGVRYMVLENRRRDDNDKHEFIGEQVVWLSPGGDIQHPLRQQPAPARLLGESTPLPQDADRLTALADWLAGPGRLPFARVQANRVWSHLMGRGLVHPVDDFRATNPPSHPELLEFLTGELAGSGFDLRSLIRLICLSQTYRLASEPRPSNVSDAVNYSHVHPRRLDAEQLLDSLASTLETPLSFAGYPDGLRAGQIPGVKAARRRSGGATGEDHFLEVFGKPPRLLSSEEERSCNPTMNQVFHLVSGKLMHALLTDPDNRLAALLESNLSNAQILDQLYFAALSRPPSPAESVPLLTHLEQTANRRAALEDIAWALVNSKEFLMRH